METVSLKDGDKIVIREYEDEDFKFIISSWLQSFKNSKYTGPIPNNLYWDTYSTAIEQLLTREGVVILIACNPIKTSQIFGYIVVEENRDLPVLHWVYVKHAGLRNLGICSALMKYCGIDRDTEFYYTYKSVSASKLFSPVGPWPRGRHKDSIAKKKRGRINETTGYLVPYTSKNEEGQTA